MERVAIGAVGLLALVLAVDCGHLVAGRLRRKRGETLGSGMHLPRFRRMLNSPIRIYQNLTRIRI